MSYDPPTDEEESAPIRLDSQGIPILQEVVISEAGPVTGRDSTTPQAPLAEPPGYPEVIAVDALQRELESRFQQVIEEQVELLTGQFRDQLTSTLRQALAETLERLSTGAGRKDDRGGSGGDDSAS
ncbi:MAG: hypothetical protein OQL28_01010 [Sedimenticola sp.]|nr:hypothetical protein [Sedimenticola sp.]